jgi:hypothetical protein
MEVFLWWFGPKNLSLVREEFWVAFNWGLQREEVVMQTPGDRHFWCGE